MKKRIFVWANLGISVAVLTSTLDTKAQSSQPLSTVPLGAYIGAAQNDTLGLFEILSRHEFVTTKTKFGSINSIDFWDLPSGHIKSRIVPPEPIDAVQLSPDARRLIATQAVLGDPKHKVYNPHKLFVWSARTKKLLRVIDFGEHVFVRDIVFWPDKPEQVIVQISPIDSLKTRLFHLDLNTGRFGRPVKYPAAKYLFHSFWGYSVFSPNKKMLASVDEMGEGFAGSVDIVDVRTGRVHMHYEAQFSQQPVFGDAFFLSNTRFFFGSWLDTHANAPAFAGYSFDFTKSKLRLRGESKLRCLSDVPSRRGQGFFQSKYGLELWDIAWQKRLRRWPRLKNVEQIAISHDGKTAGFYYREEQDESEWNPQQPFHVAVQIWDF